MSRLFVLLSLMAAAVMLLGAAPPVDALATDGSAQARLVDAEGLEVGVVAFTQTAGEPVVVQVDVHGFTPGFHGFHIHAGGSCTGPNGEIDFSRTEGHLGHSDPDATPHGQHPGDLPVLYADAGGRARAEFRFDRFDLDDIDGRTVVIHGAADNYANVPPRYHHIPDASQTGPDATTRSSGDAGDRVACGVVGPGSTTFHDPAATGRAEAVLVNAAGGPIGQVELVDRADGSTAVTTVVNNLTPGFHGFHIHAGPACRDADGQVDFSQAGGHLGHSNPLSTPHGQHPGDMPVLHVNDSGIARATYVLDRVSATEVIGHTIVVHGAPDNYANIPPMRYLSDQQGIPGPDSATRTSGDAGERQACGEIVQSGDVVRLAGATRIETAVAASQSSFPAPDSAGAVVLARADAFPDGLAGAPLATAKGGPLLLTYSDGLTAAAEEELERVLPDEGSVYLLGGEQALSAAVEQRVQELGYTANRLGGATRFETAIAIADEIGAPAAVLIATGVRFPDALAAGAAAADESAVVVFSDGDQPHAATDGYLEAHPDVARYAVGGPAVAAYPDAQSVTGETRVHTALAVAEQFFAAPTAVGLARAGDAGDDSDDTFADALAGGAHVGSVGGPLLLTPTADLHSAVGAYLCAATGSVGTVYLYGGEQALTSGVEQAARRAATGVGCSAP